MKTGAIGVPASEAAPGGWRRLQAVLADTPAILIARKVVFLAVLLLSWISLKPFQDLSNPDVLELATGREGLTYASFGLFRAAVPRPDSPSSRQSLARLRLALVPGARSLARRQCRSVTGSHDVGQAPDPGGLRDAGGRLPALAGAVAERSAQPPRHRFPAAAGRLLSRHAARAGPCHPSGEGRGRAHARGQLARRVRP